MHLSEVVMEYILRYQGVGSTDAAAGGNAYVDFYISKSGSRSIL